MSKTQKELVFLQDLYISKDWTERFTTSVNTHFKLPKKGKFLYVNIGTANHALELIEKMDRTAEIIGVSDNDEIEKIAKAKVELMKANINFKNLDKLESESFDAALADLSFVKSKDIANLLDEITFLTKKKGKIAFFLPTAGSYGDIFSFLWETFLGVELIERSGEIERLISEIPPVSDVEEIAQNVGLKNIETHTSIEIFEYDTGEEFTTSSLIKDFFLPNWLDFLSDKERKKAVKKLGQLIDVERGHLTFRFLVKATLIIGEKG